ncbi:thioredoxin family protein [Flavitalea sp. BT771]|uniref:thioredoxin family protein n=1 Tax=Flavitalea sp. BT771 TaxID=3063329 RepID=UPI0026E2AF4C|nr:thioredoxin family protein [Flavitalea sp. BT771]MDO6435351.1 thioredoxin family protein [Flavitalea sp. BT771]MDV6224289.1 thioredoxin family protein [Flavitalea sp. BT771]
MSRTITRSHLQKEVITSGHLSLVHFRTDWSGACHIIAPVYEDLSNSYKGKVDFFSIDVEQETGIGTELGVPEIPTILFFRDGEVVDRVVGLISRTILVTRIEHALTATNKNTF